MSVSSSHQYYLNNKPTLTMRGGIDTDQRIVLHAQTKAGEVSH